MWQNNGFGGGNGNINHENNSFSTFVGSAGPQTLYQQRNPVDMIQFDDLADDSFAPDVSLFSEDQFSQKHILQSRQSQVSAGFVLGSGQ
jgi:hypothetical protein